ncbi:hypothetical protein [Tsukamurella sp. PLM1]|uniref:hypothetical protein n=1 Tax=Tsukamurella sp. PLM1 TaxID=2929795 RepID=UPI0020BD72FF|nr:hypothetical protein [Tsukamurella sp. PLM1]
MIGTTTAALVGAAGLAAGGGTAAADPQACRADGRMSVMAVQEMTGSVPGHGPDTPVPGKARIEISVPEWKQTPWTGTVSWHDPVTGARGVLGPERPHPVAPAFTTFYAVPTGPGTKTLTASATGHGGETLTCSGTFTIR